MMVLIDAEVFSSSTVDTVGIIGLFKLAVDGQHAVLPDPLDSEEFTTWLSKRDPELQEECRFAVEASLDQLKPVIPALQVRVTLTDHERWTEPAELPAGRAEQLLRQPLAIVLENARTDRAFLLAVADRHQRRALEHALENQWIRYDHGGGILEMAEQLEERRTQPWQLRRSFWVFDSDAVAPGHPSPASHGLQKGCEKARAFHHRLHRRAAENYLPLPALRARWAGGDAGRKRTVRAFDTLRPEQRHHYNMKKGLDGDRARLDEYSRKPSSLKNTEAAQALYGDLAAEPRAALAKGFGEGVRELFSDPQVLQHESWFHADDPRGEARRLIDTILNLC